MWMPLPPLIGGEEIGREPAHRVGADREERDVAEVEQAREPDDDVEPERHHDVREREDPEVERDR